MFYSVKMRGKLLYMGVCGLLGVAIICLMVPVFGRAMEAGDKEEKKDFIKWVDFDVPSSLMRKAIDADIESYEGEHVDWIDILAYLGAKYGGDFGYYKEKDFTAAVEKLRAAEDLSGMPNYNSYNYYKEAYGAVLGGIVGEYEVQGEEGWERRYGIKAYSPIAKTFPYNDYDDFGVSREYGYRRRHLGHDMMAAVGTPVIAVESGTVEALGWNQYGGWRVGIRSFDGLRYHYYAHLRKDRPFAQGLELGGTVMAGDVIGYVGRTGYSASENVNGIKESHLHYGLQIIFDESQKEGNGEIWVDVYGICQLLRRSQSQVQRDDETKEWTRTQAYREP